MGNEPRPRPPERLYIGRMFYPVRALGPGERVGIWFAGCSLGCPGCMTPEFWERHPRFARRPEEVLAWLERVPRHVREVTISGGEPFEQPQALHWLLAVLRERGFDDIWVYSGHILERLQRRHAEVLRLIDVLIDGPYRADQPTDLIWRGSANQRMWLLSEQARTRHRRWVTHRVSRPVLQIVPEEGRFVVIGVPRAGTWERLQQRLAEMGLGEGETRGAQAAHGGQNEAAS